MAAPADDLVQKLRDLGISDRSARFALSRTNNNVEQAAEYVFSGRADKDEVSNNSSEILVSPTASTAPSAEDVTRSAEHASSAPASRAASPSRWQRHMRFKRRSVPGRSRASSSGGSPLRVVTERKALVLDAETPAAFEALSETHGTHILTQDSCATDATSPESLSKQSNNLIMNALGRRDSAPSSQSQASHTPLHHLPHLHNGKGSNAAITSKPTAGALAALGLRAAAAAGPTITPPTPIEPSAGANTPPSVKTGTKSPSAKSFLLPSRPIGGGSSKSSNKSVSGSAAPSRSPSPFFRARKAREEAREERHQRDPSPDVVALRKDSVTDSIGDESDAGERGRGRGRYRPRNSAYDSPDSSGNEADDNADAHEDSDDDYDDDLGPNKFDDDDDEWDPELFFDDETERNTEANAFYAQSTCDSAFPDGVDGKEGGPRPDNFDVYGEETEQDMLGEGPNVIIPREPLFAPPQSKVKKSARTGLELTVGRPMFARDRCTVTITQGDPDEALDRSGKRMRRYVVLSDLSDESWYAGEWAIGTVARDGDEVFIISVMENEDKVDPKHWSGSNQSQKVKVQKERQTTALYLVRQVTSLLERTRLNITVTCQALHAKNARHMLLDLIDFLEPTLVIVGSRGLGQLKGILLGSTSHYLVQKSSVPVMVARRRLRRPLRRTNPEDLRRSPRVSLASANIEKTPSMKQEDDIIDAADDVTDDPKGDSHHSHHHSHGSGGDTDTGAIAA